MVVKKRAIVDCHGKVSLLKQQQDMRPLLGLRLLAFMKSGTVDYIEKYGFIGACQLNNNPAEIQPAWRLIDRHVI